ncbi:hypothetical protein GCM10009116_13780 [Brevundimonas basaltis]|uniref:Uncharacterized protein n=1 Tax=Brevundimonas basaltis TaxID=472166 RepID=A0A7W8HYC6_9CAUL|nr:hypothetical protein [Brevundimonas basaltis]MBB5291308.1 hypothetical protein [Brevundimonas basaltis]
MTNAWLAAGGALSAAASLTHLAIIVGGPRWYDFFGAGPHMVRLAEQGSPKATLITLGIAAVLAVWAAYALSGAGLMPRLPLLKLALFAISAVYLVRALGYIPLLAATGATVGTFAWVSSIIVLVYAVIHMAGTVQLWRS